MCRTFECIVDTGASDTVLSHSVVRRLGIMNNLVPSQISFLTAAGKTEKPMGMLTNLPITIGSLTLPIDCMVTRANNYNILIGNDWLRMAGADILLSSAILRVRLGPDQYEDIPIDTDNGIPKAHLCQQGEPKAVRSAIQCLEHRQPMMTRTVTEVNLEASSNSEYSTDLDSTDLESEEEEDTSPETTTLQMNLAGTTIQDPSPNTQVTPTLQDSNPSTDSDSDSVSDSNSASSLHSAPETATAPTSPFLSTSSQVWTHDCGLDNDHDSFAPASWNGQEPDPCETTLRTPDTFVRPHTVGLTLPAAVCLFVTDSNTDDTPSAVDDDSEEEPGMDNAIDLPKQATTDDSTHILDIIQHSRQAQRACSLWRSFPAVDTRF